MVSILVVAVALIFFVLRVRRQRNNQHLKDAGGAFRADIGFSDVDGMASLALLLSNNGETDVWVEEVEIFLTDLDAGYQAARQSCHEIQPIRERLEAGDKSSFSLSAAVYKASGECQRWYSFVLSSVVRYRIGQQWVEKNLNAYQVEMIGFITTSLRRERKRRRTLQSENKPRDDLVVGAKSNPDKSAYRWLGFFISQQR